jgi:hypothetical protein
MRRHRHRPLLLHPCYTPVKTAHHHRHGSGGTHQQQAGFTPYSLSGVTESLIAPKSRRCRRRQSREVPLLLTSAQPLSQT